MKPHQFDMFPDGDDLPLMSGTPARSTDRPFEPTEAARQARLGSCPTCLDTGSAGGRRCWCAAGQAAQ